MKLSNQLNELAQAKNSPPLKLLKSNPIQKQQNTVK